MVQHTTIFREVSMGDILSLSTSLCVAFIKNCKALLEPLNHYLFLLRNGSLPFLDLLGAVFLVVLNTIQIELFSGCFFMVWAFLVLAEIIVWLVFMLFFFFWRGRGA